VIPVQKRWDKILQKVMGVVVEYYKLTCMLDQNSDDLVEGATKFP